MENVHGVRRTCLDIGKELKCRLVLTQHTGGLASLVELMKYAEKSVGLKVIDKYGGRGHKTSQRTQEFNNQPVSKYFETKTH